MVGTGWLTACLNPATSAADTLSDYIWHGKQGTVVSAKYQLLTAGKTQASLSLKSAENTKTLMRDMPPKGAKKKSLHPAHDNTSTLYTSLAVKDMTRIATTSHRSKNIQKLDKTGLEKHA